MDSTYHRRPPESGFVALKAPNIMPDAGVVQSCSIFLNVSLRKQSLGRGGRKAQEPISESRAPNSEAPAKLPFIRCEQDHQNQLKLPTRAAQTMSYYFAIVGTQDNPLFEYEFGTAKQGGDGVARFAEQARHMNQFIVHSSLDIVEEVQWGNGQMYVLLGVSVPASTSADLVPSQVSQVHRSVLPELRLVLDYRRQ